MEVAIEIPICGKFENNNKMVDSCFVISNQSDVEQLKENSKLDYFESNTVKSLPELGNRTESQLEN